MRKVKRVHTNIFAAIVDHYAFQRSIITVILLAAALVGLETYPALYRQYHDTFRIADYVLQGIFTIEIILRLLSYGKNPLAFFRSSANVIDFVITALFYFPFGGAYASVLRLFRIIRIFRLFTALPRLQLLVGALIKSVPSMGYISLLLLIQMYIYAVLGNFLFGKNDPTHFGDLGAALMTLFQIITLEGWVDIMQAQQSSFIVPLYFVSFILIGTMIVLNLFIGVIMTGFDEVKKEIDDELSLNQKKNSLREEILSISAQLGELNKRLTALAVISKKEKKN